MAKGSCIFMGSVREGWRDGDRDRDRVRDREGEKGRGGAAGKLIEGGAIRDTETET